MLHVMYQNTALYTSDVQNAFVVSPCYIQQAFVAAAEVTGNLLVVCMLHIEVKALAQIQPVDVLKYLHVLFMMIQVLVV